MINRTQLLSIQVGLPQTLTDDHSAGSAEKTWTTAFFKQPVAGRVRLGKTNVAGDRQASATHGGPDKAVCVYPFEHYSYWQTEFDLPHLGFGAFGENFTVQGLLEDEACIGDTFVFGDAVAQISQPRPPCWRLARWWKREDFAARMEQTGRTGWYLRVIEEGYVEAGMKVELAERSYPEWSVSLAHDLLYDHRDDLEEMRRLADCPLLSEGWRDGLLKKLSKRAERA